MASGASSIDDWNLYLQLRLLWESYFLIQLSRWCFLLHTAKAGTSNLICTKWNVLSNLSISISTTTTRIPSSLTWMVIVTSDLGLLTLPWPFFKLSSSCSKSDFFVVQKSNLIRNLSVVSQLIKDERQHLTCPKRLYMVWLLVCFFSFVFNFLLCCSVCTRLLSVSVTEPVCSIQDVFVLLFFQCGILFSLLFF